MLSSSEKGGGQITTTKFNGLILRHQFSDPAKLYVWVQAKNQHGSANSSMVVFNTTDISKEDLFYHNYMMPFLSGDFNNIF